MNRIIHLHRRGHDGAALRGYGEQEASENEVAVRHALIELLRNAKKEERRWMLTAYASMCLAGVFAILWVLA